MKDYKWSSDQPIQSTYDVVHYVNIKVLGKNREVIQFLMWSGLRFDLRQKYDWYFKYRAALCQVQNPRCDVQYIWGHEPAVGKSLERIKQDKIRAKKAKITEHKNKLKRIEDGWNEIFPLSSYPGYQKAIDKIAALEFELQSLINQPTSL